MKLLTEMIKLYRKNFRHIDPYVALENPDNLNLLIVNGSVSLHKQIANYKRDIITTNSDLITEKERCNNMAHFGLASPDIQNSKVRQWWKRRQVDEAELVLTPGTFLGGESRMMVKITEFIQT